MTVEEEVFDESYNSMLQCLLERSKGSGFSLKAVQAELDHLCVFEGQDWEGRGELKQSEIAGSILAYQTFLMRFSDEQES